MLLNRDIILLMEKTYRVFYITLDKKGTYDLMAIDRVDAIHQTLRKYPWLVVYAAEIVV